MSESIKIKYKFLAAACAALCAMAAVAGVTVKWTAETSRVQPELLEAWRGDTLDLACTLTSYGRPVSLGAATASFMWQTNGMGNAWWQTNATITAGGVVRATWSPTMDPGAAEVAFFMPVQGADGASYRAAGRLRFRPSPGAGSETIDLPAPGSTLDFGDYQLVNAPWTTIESVNNAIVANNAIIADAIAGATGALEIPPPVDLGPYATTGMVSAAVQTSGNALAGQINAVSNAAMQRAEMGAYATQQDVSTAIAGIQIPSLEGYATETYVASAIAGIELPSLDGYATTAYADAAASNAQANAIAAIPSLAGYATESYVASAIEGIELPSLDGYATRTYADAAASNAEANAIAAIPSLAGYATESYVASAIEGIELPSLDGYATTAYADAAASNAQANAMAAIPSLAGYATETYVASAIEGIELPSLDGYATTAYADAAASNAEANAIAAIPSLEGFATQSWTADYVNDRLDRGIVIEAETTRLATPDGLIWQDATGTVWQVSVADYGWTGTVINLSTAAVRPITFEYAGTTTNAPSIIGRETDYWSAGGGTNLYYDTWMGEHWQLWWVGGYLDYGSNTVWQVDGDPTPPASATNLTFTTSIERYNLFYAPAGLVTNPVDRVLYASGGGGADPGNYAAVSNAAMSAAAQTNDFLRLTGGYMNGSICFPYANGYGVGISPLHPGALSFRSTYPDYSGLSATLDLTRIPTDDPFYGNADIAYLSDIPSTNGFFKVDREVEYGDYWRLYGTLLDNGTYKWTLGFPDNAMNVFYWLPDYTEGSSETQMPDDWGYDVYLASRGYVQQQVGLKATRTDISNAVTPVSNKVETTAAIVDSWEGYWGATNVELRVTNYYGNTTGALPRLQIREHRDGHWTNVWDEIDKFIACKAEILHEVAQSNATLLAEADRKYAPKAWGSHTDKGTTNVIPNSVYMSSPETYFGGGTEFQRVAVGSGAVSVLVDKGALAKTTGEPGTFRFQDAGGTNYFGFVKSDSYTIGCRTDGISVGAGNAITLRYDVIMSGEDVPVVYWKQQLESATPWAQLNNPNGTAADGAPYAVTWLQDGGSYYATVNCGGSPSGFFVAETSVAGDVVWETNMKARLGGGIECTNTATHVNGVIRPSYNGSSVTWEWSAR